MTGFYNLSQLLFIAKEEQARKQRQEREDSKKERRWILSPSRKNRHERRRKSGKIQRDLDARFRALLKINNNQHSETSQHNRQRKYN